MTARACAKRRYRDRIAADLALAKIVRADRTDRPKTERRAYHCPRCNRYHLTSEEEA